MIQLFLFISFGTGTAMLRVLCRLAVVVGYVIHIAYRESTVNVTVKVKVNHIDGYYILHKDSSTYIMPSERGKGMNK